MRAWMVRGGADGEREAIALADSRVYVGFGDIANLEGMHVPQIKEALRDALADASPSQIGAWAGQLDRLVNQMQVGDIVVMPMKTAGGALAIGIIDSAYEYLPLAEPGMRHTRRVQWHRRNVARDVLRTDLRASLGSLLTICELQRNESADRLKHVLREGVDPGVGVEPWVTVEELATLAENGPVTTTARRLLELAGSHRRTVSSMASVEEILKQNGLELKGTLDFGLIEDAVSVERLIDDVDSEVMEDDSDGGAVKPFRVSLQVSNLPSARLALESVAPDDAIEIARIKMLEHNFSQLPVIDEGALVGVVTWESMAMAAAAGVVRVVREATTPAPSIIGLGQNLLDVVATIETHGYAFVQGDLDQIGGIVTISDLASLFGRDRRPLVQVEEIELRLRRAVQARFSDEDVAASKARANTVDDMTFGTYAFLLQDGDCWRRLGWTSIEQSRFLALLELVRKVRNNLMHFSQDPLNEEEAEVLARMLRVLRGVDRDLGRSRERVRPVAS